MRISAGVDLQGNISGGIPIGRVTRIYGSESTGKTLLSWDAIAAAQIFQSARFPHGLSCVYWNVEKQFDPAFARRHGVDVSKLGVMQTVIIEDIAGQMDVLLSSRHLHVIDSASFATPMEELVGPKKQGKATKTPEYEVQVGAHARAWKRAINRIHNRMDKDENVVIILDHVGTDMTTQSEKPLSGRRMAFRSDLSIHLKRGPWLFYNKHGRLDTNDAIAKDEGMGPAGLKEPDGIEITARVEKARVCRPLRVCKMRLDINKSSFDYLWELAEMSRYLDEDGEMAHDTGKDAIVPTTKNGFYHVPGQHKALHGFDAYYEHLSNDAELQALIRSKMLTA
jgi:RecA/RadA recombinase